MRIRIGQIFRVEHPSDRRRSIIPGNYYSYYELTRGNHSVGADINKGIWAYNGLFRLIDAWQEVSNARKVFKIRLELLSDIYQTDSETNKIPDTELKDIEHNRIIPASVKLEVWKRDKGRCLICSSKDNLHFDHIIPYSKGGSSLVANNIQLLCARHNLAKRNRIE